MLKKHYFIFYSFSLSHWQGFKFCNLINCKKKKHKEFQITLLIVIRCHYFQKQICTLLFSIAYQIYLFCLCNLVLQFDLWFIISAKPHLSTLLCFIRALFVNVSYNPIYETCFLTCKQ